MSKNEQEMTLNSSQMKEKQSSEIDKLLKDFNEEKQEWNEIRESTSYL